ncbi:PHB depolymerase family esterase [Dyella choica]|uniref:Alpha/beta hydrolase n=1 Tax=Dyella choica TaxID=1927959 RepID=A0A432LZV3_9GAMM|nr:PHB depolymerase family esterase [Dyella choica]RUL69517.1 hypothetical protein EKH80_22115 [Dyella choica]
MKGSGTRFSLLLAGLSVLPCATAIATDPPATGLFTDVVFSQYSPLSGSRQLATRMLSPLDAARLQQRTDDVQPIGLEHERFALYVPAKEPPDGYALLVFVPPWDEARVPPRWTGVLERRGIILVTAAHSGNEADPLDRREPLALLSAINVMARYRIDPRRIYVGGFSGGSRVALRLAVGYPDLFHGVLLDAGSDPLGDTIPLPQASLMEQLQTSTRLVYLTGLEDRERLEMDRLSRHSLDKWCITDVDTVTMPWLGHELANPAALERALLALDQHHPVDQDKLKACRARIEQALNAELDQAGQSLQNGRIDVAGQLLRHINAYYGGLAATQLWQLERSEPRQPLPRSPNPSPALQAVPDQQTQTKRD